MSLLFFSWADCYIFTNWNGILGNGVWCQGNTLLVMGFFAGEMVLLGCVFFTVVFFWNPHLASITGRLDHVEGLLSTDRVSNE